MNTEIKQAMKKHGVKQWMVADRLGCADTTLCRRLRKELPDAEKQKIMVIIARLAKEES